MKRAALMLTTGAVVLLGARTAVAERSALGQGTEVGLRAGYGLPLGKATSDATESMSWAVTGTVPIWLDAGVRITPVVFAGFYASYAFGFVNKQHMDCTSNTSCSSFVVRGGAQVQFHLLPDGPRDPWLGLGVGYEVWGLNRTVNAAGGSFETSSTSRGIEFANIQAGLDFKPSLQVGLGPFAAASLVQYDSFDRLEGGARTSPNLGKSLHAWIQLGVRGFWDL